MEPRMSRRPAIFGLALVLACGAFDERVERARFDVVHPLPTTDHPAPAIVDGRMIPYVTTNAYGNRRTGTNTSETVLTSRNVGPATFGLLFSRVVEGEIYAQPLVVPRWPIGDRQRDVVFVATQHNVVYAFDATDAAHEAPLWETRLGPSVPVGELPNECRAMQTEIGVTVISVALRTMWVVAYVNARAEEGGRTWRLFALDLTTGRPREGFESGVVLEAELPGWSDDEPATPWSVIDHDDDERVRFRPEMQLQRAGLLLSNGVLYIAFAGHCDAEPFHGWVLAYDAATLAPRGAFVTTPRGSGGGIWQSGRGLAADEVGDVYAISGNGTFDDEPLKPQLSMAFLRLRLEGNTLSPVDWFTPRDYWELSRRDLDLGSSGPVLVPGTNRLVGGGKDGRLFLLDTANMGRFHDDRDGVLQGFLATQPGLLSHIHGSPVHWQSRDRAYVYLWGESDALKAFAFEGGRLVETPTQVSTRSLGPGMPGGILTVSSDGDDAASGIVWASHATSEDSSGRLVPGTLAAFAATDVARELWNSDAAGERDRVGIFARFNPPTVAGGRVYLGTFSNALRVYGQHPSVD